MYLKLCFLIVQFVLCKVYILHSDILYVALAGYIFVQKAKISGDKLSGNIIKSEALQSWSANMVRRYGMVRRNNISK